MKWTDILLESCFFVMFFYTAWPTCLQLSLILKKQKHHFIWHKLDIFLSWIPCFEVFAPGSSGSCLWCFTGMYCLSIFTGKVSWAVPSISSILYWSMEHADNERLTGLANEEWTFIMSIIPKLKKKSIHGT